MGRDQSNPVWKHFAFNRDANTCTCKIGDCTVVMKGSHAANLERHVQRHHPIEYAAIKKTKESKNECGVKHKIGSGDTSINVDLDGPLCKQMKQPTIQSVFSSTIKVQISASTILDACIELTTVNGRPFKLMDDSGFRKILDPVLAGLGNAITINAENICGRISIVAGKIRDEISSTVKGKIVSLKVDVATCLDRSVLGVNVQYISKGKIEVRTLAMKELTAKHTSEYLKVVILEVIASYGISPMQIYTITTDNGANMVKVIKLLIEDQQENGDLESDESDVECELTKTSKSRQSKDIAQRILLQEGDRNERNKSVLQAIEDDQIEINMVGITLCGVRCAAHTLQLAVEDAIKEGGVQEIVAKARNVAKKTKESYNVGHFEKVEIEKAYPGLCNSMELHL